MIESLQKIQARVQAYVAEKDKIVKEYHDEKSMVYFSDRFGPDHPGSPRADYGVRLQRAIRTMQQRIDEFVDSLEAEFPDLEGE